MKKNRTFTLLRWTALLLALCLLPILSLAEETEQEDTWESFLLICNEGMNNAKGNAGNTLMVAAMDPVRGKIHLMMFTWDTFIDYEGYDVPQRLDMPYRNNGPEEAVRVFNDNFGLNIKHYLSLNCLNLAALIDEYGGINVEVTRAERNALNGMVSSKKVRLLEEAASGQLGQNVVDMLAKEYYLNDFGPDTHLNGLQAVGFGWLQYDSVYNCCERDADVIAALFHSCGSYIADKVALYTDESGLPEDAFARRPINLDNITEEDYQFLHEQIAPIFQMSENNMEEDEIRSITLSLARIAYQAEREGTSIFDLIDSTVLPLEATKPYDFIAGAQGHIIDKAANIQKVKEFLYNED